MPDIEKQQFYELSFYTLNPGDKTFIHQHIVDAQTAQTADENTKPIAIIFALVGLYLHIEKKFTGREVQLFHIKMAKNKRDWPVINLPEKRGDIRVSDILAVPEGEERNAMIRKWCESVWNAFRDNREIIVNLVQSYFKK